MLTEIFDDGKLKVMDIRRFLVVGGVWALGLVLLWSILAFGIAKKSPHMNTLYSAPMAAPNEDAPIGSSQDKMAIGVSPEFMPGPQAAPTDTKDRIVIKNGTVSLVVKAFQPAIDKVTQIAQGQGGYVTNYAIAQDEPVPPIDGMPMQAQSLPLRYEEDGKRLPRPQLGTATVLLRVPADKLDATMNQLRSVGTRVISESVNGDDVTDQFVDLNARLKNLQATEAQLQKILSQANNTQDTLAVYNQLSSTRSQIESLQGQINYLNQSAKLSQITVTMRQEADGVVKNRIETWQPFVVAKEASNSLINLFKGLADLVIWLVVFTPIWVPLATLAWYINKRMKRPQG